MESVEANVEAKTVIVEADPSVTPESMLEALQKVSEVVSGHLCVCVCLNGLSGRLNGLYLSWCRYAIPVDVWVAFNT